MAEPVETLVGWVLAAYRDPLRYQKQLRGPLPVPFQPVLQLAAGKTDPGEAGDLCRRWEATPEELRQAAVFFVEQACLQGEEDDPYRILGLEPGAVPQQIQAHYQLLMLLFHPDRREATANWRDGYAARINQAYQQLRSAAGRQRQRAVQKEESVQARRKPAVRAAPHRGWRRPRKRSRLLYLTRRFPRLVRRLPHLILGGGIALTFGLVVSLYFSRTEVETSAAVLEETPAAAPSSGGRPPSPPPSPEVLPGAVSRALTPSIASPPKQATPSAEPPLAGLQKEEEAAAAQAERKTATVPQQDVAAVSGSVSVPGLEKAQEVIQRFASAYQQGDLEDFLTLFSADIRTSEYFGKSALREDYGRFFAATKAREFQLKELQWTFAGDTTQGKGRYWVRVRKPTGTVQSQGQIHFQVQERAGNSVITGFFYTVEKEQQDVSSAN
jgi:hypothetical protein